MAFNFDLINIFILLVIVSNSILGLFIYLSNRKEPVNINFFIFSITATMWGVTMFLFRSFPEFNSDGFFARILYASAATIPFVFLYFIRFFPTSRFGMTRIKIQLLSVPFLIVFSLALLPNMLIVSSYQPVVGEPIIVFNKLFHTFYALYITSYFSICYFLLFYKYYKSEGIEKIQLAYVITGTLVATMIGVSTNLIFPYFGDFKFNWMGQIGVISMIGAIAYSIMKHKLFNMKVLATQFTVVILCISLFTKVLFSVDQKDFIINIIILIITGIIGLFLIRSVIGEVRQREQIEKLADDLRIANQGQSSIMHFMNHQVKGRLGNIKNIFAELMTDDYGQMPPDSKPLLNKGLDEADIGVNYVQNILKGASAENGTLPYDMKLMDFKSVVTDAFEKQRDRAESRGLKFNLAVSEGDYSMTGDSLQLGESIRNLIDNSINYTQEGEINLQLSVSDNKIRLAIKDTGVGLSPEDKAKLFKSGGRGDESIKININSTGYGLVFVKGVVESHKGKVWAESDGRGKGSVFIVEIPKS